ncbi:MAG: GNAT family N-acetyltransferase [bacterium]|nr:GNAT family N-acetyltransferase [bacterium]
MDIQIREAKIEDYDDINALYKEVDEFHFEMKPNRLKGPGHFGREKQHFEGVIKNKNSTILVATQGTAIVGFAELVIENEPESNFLHPENHVEIEFFVVKESYRGSGVGRLLMRGVEDWAKAKKIKALTLNAHSANEMALGFYQKNGYKITSINLRKDL